MQTDIWYIALLCSENRVILASAAFGHNTHNSDNRAMNWRSRSFKVINFCCNRKPTYDFLLVINCHLSSISHRFRDIASRSYKFPPQVEPTIERTPLNFVIKLGKQTVKTLGYEWKLHDYIFSHFVTIHSRFRQTIQTERRHIMTTAKHCNETATVG